MALYHFNQQGLEKAVSSGGLVMVDMWAPWCAPCRMLGPTVEKLAEQYDGKAVIGKLNTDENQQLAMQLGIMGIPCVIFFKDGREIDRKVGLMPAQAYTAVLDANL
ncbi:MAG: thioredoxin [Clostridiales bacterium]|nr:thioredoxin [Clostridiales bacterium]